MKVVGEQHAEDGCTPDDGPDRRAFNPQSGKAHVAEDQNVIERNIHDHAGEVGEHDDPRLADAEEKPH